MLSLIFPRLWYARYNTTPIKAYIKKPIKFVDAWLILKMTDDKINGNQKKWRLNNDSLNIPLNVNSSKYGATNVITTNRTIIPNTTSKLISLTWSNTPIIALSFSVTSSLYT